jgi:hypothetical protein
MQRSKLIAVGVYLGAVLIGGVVGIAMDRSARDRMDERAQDAGKARQTFAQRLGLSAEQQAAADSIFGRARRMDSLLFAPIRAQMRAIRPQADSAWSAARDEFRTRLTPDQQRAYDEMNERRQGSANGRR